jgi:hypothetical protein
MIPARLHGSQMEPLKYIARSPTLGDKAAFQCWWCSKAAWLTKPPSAVCCGISIRKF